MEDFCSKKWQKFSGFGSLGGGCIVDKRRKKMKQRGEREAIGGCS